MTTKITKSVLHNFRTDLNAALADLQIKYDFNIEVGNMRFSDEQVKISLKATVKGATPEIQKHYEHNAALWGLPPLGTTITIAGKRLTIKGFKASNRKYPVLADAPNGSSYKLSTDQVKQAARA